MFDKTDRRKMRWAYSGVALALALVCSCALAQGHGHAAHSRGGWNPGPHPGWALDSRFHHDRYYPVRGAFLTTLPGGYLHVMVGREPYFFYGGAWFRPYPRGYIVVDAPFGAVISTLPYGYTVVWVGALAYYYANGVYYADAPSGGYQVVSPPPVLAGPPPAAAAATPPAAAPQVRSLPSGDGLYVYSRQSRSALQEANDRHECDLWAQKQTGYDFERPAQTDPSRFDDFQRAAIACLDARGYSAR